MVNMLTRLPMLTTKSNVRFWCATHLGAKSISTLGRRQRNRNNVDFSSLVKVLDRNIVQYFTYSQGRSFSHLYRKHKVTPCSTGWTLGTKAGLHETELNVQWHSCQFRNHRSYATNYRKYSNTLLLQLSSFLYSLFPHGREYRSNKSHAASISDILGSRGFSHIYRKRQLAPIRAYIPSHRLGRDNRRFLSSATAQTAISSESAQGSKTSWVTWGTRVMAAGITIILALRFLEETSEVESHGLSDSIYTPWQIYNIEQVSPKASIFTLKAKTGSGLSTFAPLSSISIKEPNSNIQRPYTILSLEDDTIKILVKRYAGGELSRFIHSRKLDSNLFLKKVASEYTLPENVPSRFVMISGGTGIATSYQLLEHFARMPVEVRPEVRLLYASINADEVYLQKEFKELKKLLGDKLHMEYFIDSWGAVIDDQDVRRAYRDWDLATTLVCGSDGFVAYIAGQKPEVGQGSIGGLLSTNGVQNDVWKL